MSSHSSSVSGPTSLEPLFSNSPQNERKEHPNTLLSLDNFKSKEDSLTATVTFDTKPLFFHGRGKLGDPEKKSITDSYTLQLQYRINAEKYVVPVYIDQHFRGFTPLSPYNNFRNTTIDCIIVHGFGGHAFGSWRDSSSAFNWTRDKLPNDHPELNVLTYGYDAYYRVENNADVHEWAEGFRHDLRHWRSETNGNLEARPILFFVHSLGGFIFKEVLITIHDIKNVEDLKMVQSIYGALFFGVPSQGMDTRDLAAMVQGLPARYTVELLNRDVGCRLRERQHAKFCDAFPFKDSKIIQFVETLGTKVGENDYRLLVNQHSGSYGRPWETNEEYVQSIRADHRSMVKLSPASEDYTRISFILRKSFIPEAPHTIKKRFMGHSFDAQAPNQQLTHLPGSLLLPNSEAQHLSSTPVTNHPVAPLPLPPSAGNQNIHHREGIIMKMINCLEKSGHQLPIFYLSGEAGVGKTQTARKYIDERSNIYKMIFWTNASSEEKLASDFDYVAGELDCKAKETANPEANREAVKVWLQNNSDWLLVFDNADDPSHLNPFWPSVLRKGYIIITSRSSKIANHPLVTDGARLDCFTEDEGAQVLLSKIPEDVRDYELAKQISRRLGGLPLALAHMAAYIANNDFMPLKNFLEEYDQSESDIVGSSDTSATPGYQGNLATAWNMPFSRLSDPSRDLMEVLSLLDPDKIQLDVLVTVMKQPDPKRRERARRDALSQLVKNDLVQKSNSGDASTPFLVIHRLVQDAYRRTWAPETWQRAFGAACACINNKFPKQDRGQTMVPLYSECRKYDGDILILLHHFSPREEWLDPSIEFVETLAHCGWYYFERGQFHTAKFVLETAETICNRKIRSWNPGERRDPLGQEEARRLHLTTALVFNNLASLRVQFSEFSKAEEYHRLAIRYRRRFLKADDPQIQELANSLCNYANVIRKFGRNEEAESSFRESLEIREASPGSTIPLLEVTLYNYGSWKLELGEVEEAEQILLKAKDLHPKIEQMTTTQLYTIYCLGRLEYMKGNINEALTIHKQCLNKRQQLEAWPHPLTGVSLHKVGTLELEMNREDEAIGHLRRALHAFRTSTGDRGLLPRTLITLGRVLRNKAIRTNDSDMATEGKELETEGIKLAKEYKGENVHLKNQDDLNSLVKSTYR